MNSRMKRCWKCGRRKALDAFNKCRRRADGRQAKCRACAKKDWAANRERYGKMASDRYYANREERIAKVKDYYQRNKEKRAAYIRRWYLKNRDECRRKQREYQRIPENRRRCQENCHRYYQANKAQLLVKAKAWAKSDRGRKIIYESRKRRCKKQRKAQQLVCFAVACGVLVRPSNCEGCGIECKPMGHHHKGYDAKNALDVQWLCPACHGKAHRIVI